MRQLRMAAVVCVLILSGGWRIVAAQDAVKLEYKLAPGTELAYKTEGTLTQQMAAQGISGKGVLSVETREIVCGSDAEKGLATVARLRKPSVDLTMNTPQGERKSNQARCEVAVIHTDSSGRPVSDAPQEEAAPERGSLAAVSSIVLNLLRQSALDIVTLPPQPVAVGASWESAFEFPIMGAPMRLKADSTLTGIKEVEGRKCAVILSKLPGGEAATPVKFAGEAETFFDVERGVAQAIRLAVNVTGAGFEAAFELKTRLDSVRALPPEETARYAAFAAGYDAAVSRLYQKDAEGAVKGLEGVNATELGEDWQQGVDGTLAIAKHIQRMIQASEAKASSSATPPAPPKDAAPTPK